MLDQKPVFFGRDVSGDKNTHTWQFFVPFFGWLSDPFQWLSDLQLGNQKGTLNHLVNSHQKKGPFLKGSPITGVHWYRGTFNYPLEDLDL